MAYDLIIKMLTNNGKRVIIKKERRKMKIEQINSVQQWLPFDKILENGIIKLKDSSYIKILKINSINYNLKSELEKEAILNSYKSFIKSCNFNLQILIQSKKEDLTKHIQILNQNHFYHEIKEKYIEYINSLNRNKKSSNKNFYIIIKTTSNSNNLENISIQSLQDEFFKIKEYLAKCGNIVSEYTEEEQIRDILFSFLNSRLFLSE